MNIKNIEAMADGTYLFEIEDQKHGWIHSSASPDQPAEAEVYEAIKAGTHGPIGTYTPPLASRQDVERARKAAYANPHTGSDRLFAEAQRMQLMNEPGWEDIRDQAIARFQEIQQENPWEG